MAHASPERRQDFSINASRSASLYLTNLQELDFGSVSSFRLAVSLEMFGDNHIDDWRHVSAQTVQVKGCPISEDAFRFTFSIQCPEVEDLERLGKWRKHRKVLEAEDTSILANPLAGKWCKLPRISQSD